MIMGIIGNIGEGKTALSVALAQYFKFKSKGETEIISNFTIKKPLGNEIALTPEEFSKIKYSPVHRVILLDEPYAWGIDSRRSGSNVNLVLAEKALQSRKYNIDIIYIVQLASSVDLRLRRITSCYFFAFHANKKRFKYAYFGKTTNALRIINRRLFEKFVFPFYDSFEIVGENFYEAFNNNEENGTEVEIIN